MIHDAPQSRSAQLTAAPRPARTTGWMVAAIAVHLLVTSMASAATTCSETIERTRVTRLSHCVAQAIRELVDHAAEPRPAAILDREAEPMSTSLVDGGRAIVPERLLGDWLLNLPPPMVG